MSPGTTYKASWNIEGQKGHDHAQRCDGQDGVALGQGDERQAEGRATAADCVVQLPLHPDAHQFDLNNSVCRVADGEDQDEADQIR